MDAKKPPRIEAVIGRVRSDCLLHTPARAASNWGRGIIIKKITLRFVSILCQVALLLTRINSFPYVRCWR